MTQPRKAERVRSLLSAQVSFANGSPMACVIKNISSAGVRLEIADSTPLPSEFDLAIPHKGRSYHARVAWRGAGIVGAEFMADANAPSEAVDGDGDRVDQLMKENARLRSQVLQLKQRVAELSGEG